MTQATFHYPIERWRINTLRVTFMLCLPLILFTRSAWMEPAWLFEIIENVGTFAVIGGVLGRFWAILYIGGRKNTELMQDGPYSICRHPLYFFSTLAVVGLGLMLGSFILTIILGGLTFAILSLTASQEESRMAQTFPDSWAAYTARVPRILPDPRLFRTANDVTFSVSQLRRNFFDALVFLSFIPLAELMEWLKDVNALPSVPLW